MDLELLITFTASAIAAIFSFLSYRQSKSAIISDVISRQRIEWMQNVREATIGYISIIRNPSSTIEMVLASQNKVELYLNPNNKKHKSFLNTIDICTKQFGKDNNSNISELIRDTQTLLNTFWRLAKIEAGNISKIQAKHEKKLNNIRFFT